MRMGSMFSPIMGMSSLLYFILPVPFLVYVLIRWKSEKEKLPVDPMLGIKVILYFFRSLSLLSGLTALCIVLKLLYQEHLGKESWYAGLLTGSWLVFFFLSFLIRKKTNTGAFPLAASFYAGFNLIITGIASLTSFILFTSMLFDGDSVVIPFIVFLTADTAAVMISHRFLGFSFLKKVPFLNR